MLISQHFIYLSDNANFFYSSATSIGSVNTLFTEMGTFPNPVFVYNITDNQRIQDHLALAPTQNPSVFKPLATAYRPTLL